MTETRTEGFAGGTIDRINRALGIVAQKPGKNIIIGAGDDSVFSVLKDKIGFKEEGLFGTKEIEEGVVEKWKHTNNPHILINESYINGALNSRELYVAGKERMKEIVEDFGDKS